MWIILAAEILVIRRAIEDNPELYLDELQAWLEYANPVRQMGSTVKKVLKARDQQSNVCSSLCNEGYYLVLTLLWLYTVCKFAASNHCP